MFINNKTNKVACSGAYLDFFFFSECCIVRSKQIRDVQYKLNTIKDDLYGFILPGLEKRNNLDHTR